MFIDKTEYVKRLFRKKLDIEHGKKYFLTEIEYLIPGDDKYTRFMGIELENSDEIYAFGTSNGRVHILSKKLHEFIITPSTNEFRFNDNATFINVDEDMERVLYNKRD